MTKPFFSCRWNPSRRAFSVSALRLTISSRTETRSRRCSSSEIPSPGGPLVVRLARAGDDEELVLALPAELLVEVVRRAADLADQAGTFSPPGPE